jgi:hypothetical protein
MRGQPGEGGVHERVEDLSGAINVGDAAVVDEQAAASGDPRTSGGLYVHAPLGVRLPTR